MTRTRGDALQLVGMNTRTGAAAAIGVPRDSWVPIPGVGLRQDQRLAVLRRPPAAGRDGRQPGRDPARLRLRDPVPVLRGDGRRRSAASTSTTRSPSPTTTSSPRASRQGRIHLSGVRRDGVLPDPARPARGATSTARPTSSARCAGSRPRSGRRAAEPGLPGARRAVGDEEHATPTCRPPSCSGWPRRPPRSSRARSPTASSRAASATSGAPASCCRTPIGRPAGGPRPSGRHLGVLRLNPAPPAPDVIRTEPTVAPSG